jgi:hypothetical protein
MGTNLAIITKLMLDEKNYNQGIEGALTKTQLLKERTEVLNKSLMTVSKTVGVVFVAAIAAVSAAIFTSIKATEEWGQKLDSIGDVLGTTSEESAGLAYMFTTVGGDTDQLTQALAIMAKGLQDASGNAGPTGQAINALGISFLDASGNIKPATQLFQEVADKLGPMPDGLQKTSIMMDIFGKSGKEMGDALGAAANGGMDAYIQKAKAVGLSFSDEQTVAVVNFSKAWNELKLAWQGISATVGIQVIPALTGLVTLLREKLADPAIQESIKQIGVNLAKFVTDSAPTLLSLVDVMLRLVNAALQLPAPFWVFIGALTGLLIIAGPIVQFFTTIWPLLVAIGPAFAGIGAYITTFIQLVGEAGLVATLQAAFPALTAFAASVGAAFVPVALAVLPVIALGLAIALLVKTIIEDGPAAWNTVTMMGQIMVIELAKVAGYLSGAFTAAWNAIGTVIQNFGTWIINTATTLWNSVMNVFVPVATWLVGVFVGAWNGISNAIQNVIRWLQALADEFARLTLPPWLRPGSPTPFEMGLRGIAKEMRALSETTLPEFYAQINPVMGGGMTTGGNRSGATINIYNPTGENSNSSISRTLQNLSYLGFEV